MEVWGDCPLLTAPQAGLPTPPECPKCWGHPQHLPLHLEHGLSPLPTPQTPGTCTALGSTAWAAGSDHRPLCQLGGRGVGGGKTGCPLPAPMPGTSPLAAGCTGFSPFTAFSSPCSSVSLPPFSLFLSLALSFRKGLTSPRLPTACSGSSPPLALAAGRQLSSIPFASGLSHPPSLTPGGQSQGAKLPLSMGRGVL